MKEELFQELLRSVAQMNAIRAGSHKASRRFTVAEDSSVAGVRTKRGVSQSAFATLLGISQETLQNWEQGRRQRTGPAKALLKVAARHPRLLLETVR